MKVYHDLQTFANPFIGSWRKTRRLNTLLLAWAILRVRTCCLTQLARTLPAPKKVQYRLKRFWRLLDNADAIAPADFWRQSGSWVVEQFAHRPHLVIALDATYLGNRWLLLAAMVPCKGRALPLQWAAYRLDALPKSQPQLEEDFLKELLKWLPRERPSVVLVAARGYARPQLLQWLKKRRVPFVIRLPGNYRVKGPDYTGKLNQLPLRPGQRLWWAEVVVTDARPVRVNLRVVWAEGEAEPWYLATTLPAEPEVRRFYRQRMRIEQAFRDGKSHFKVGALKRWENREHVERMLAVLTLVLLFVVWLALRRLPVGWAEQQQVWGALSYVSLVLAYIDEQWNQLLSPPWG